MICCWTNSPVLHWNRQLSMPVLYSAQDWDCCCTILVQGETFPLPLSNGAAAPMGLLRFKQPQSATGCPGVKLRCSTSARSQSCLLLPSCLSTVLNTSCPLTPKCCLSQLTVCRGHVSPCASAPSSPDGIAVLNSM